MSKATVRTEALGNIGSTFYRHRMKKLILSWFLILFISQVAFADSPAIQPPHRVESANQQFYVAFTPGDPLAGGDSGRGTAFRAVASGEDQVLWGVDFYASEAYLANDGEHMVVFGPAATEAQDLA